MLLSHLSLIFLLMSLAASSSSSSSSATTRKEFTNEFAVNLHRTSGDMDQVAQQVAEQHGFVNRGQVSDVRLCCASLASRLITRCRLTLPSRSPLITHTDRLP